MVGDLEAEGVRVGGQVDPTHPLPTEEAVGLVVVHRERQRGQRVPIDQCHRERVRPRQAHGAGLGPQTGRERLAEREDAAADAVLRLEEHRVVPGALELGRRHEPGHARADDDHPCRRVGPRCQPVGEDPELVTDGGGGHAGRLSR